MAFNRPSQIKPVAKDVVHVSSSTSLDLLLVVNALGLAGRVVPALVADHLLGPLNTLIVTVAVSGISVYLWAAIDTLAGMWMFAVVYGFFGAGIQSMFPPALANSQADISKLGVRVGMVFSVMSIGCLCGTPLAGALISSNEGGCFYAQMFGRSVMVCGALVLLVPRVLSFGWHPLRKV